MEDVFQGPQMMPEAMVCFEPYVVYVSSLYTYTYNKV